MRDYERFPSGERNSLLDWYKVKNPLIILWNYLLIRISRFMPSLTLKRFLLRLTGMRIGKDVAIGYDAQFDFFFPELIEIGDNSLIGYNATVLAHEFLVEEFRKGRVRIGKNVMLGANATVLCGVEIGDGAKVGAGAVVVDDVKPNAFVAGVPARVVKE